MRLIIFYIFLLTSLTLNGQINPTITITSSATGIYGQPINLTNLSVDTGGSTGAVSYTVANGTGSASINCCYLYLLSPGTIFLTANVAADANYNAGSATQTFTITKANPTITFTSSATGSYNGTITLTVYKGGSTGAVTYTVAGIPNEPGSAILSGSTLTLTAAGHVIVTASMASDAYYNAATVTQTISILKLNPVITFTSSQTGTYNGTINLTVNKGGSTGAVTYTVSNGTGSATLSGSTLTLTKAGTVNVTATVGADPNYNSGTTSDGVIINPAYPTIAITSSATGTYNGTINLTASTGGSNGAVTFSVSNGTGSATLYATTLTLTGVGTVTVTASVPADGGNYSAGTSPPQTITINKANPTITVTSSATGTYNGSINLTASKGGSTGAVTYSVSNGTGSATVNGSILTLTKAGTVTVTASVAADANYNAGTSAPQTVTINKANPTIAITSSSTGTYGGTINLTVNKGGSTGAVTFLVSNGTGSATVSGSTLTLTGVGTVTVTASVAADANYNAGTATQTVTISKAPQTITFNTLQALCAGATLNLNSYASTSSNLTLSYTTSNASVASISGSTLTAGSAGTAIITATQAGNQNFNSATSVSKSITINSVIITSFTGTAAVCGGNSYTYTVSLSGTGYTYAWTKPGNWSGGSTTNSVIYTLPFSPNHGAVSVVVSKGGCTDQDGITVYPGGACGGGGRMRSDVSSNGLLLDFVTEPTVFPNPVNAEMTVAVPFIAENDLPIQINPMIGVSFHAVIEKGKSYVNINTSEMPSGLYIVQLKAEEVLLIKKILVFH